MLTEPRALLPLRGGSKQNLGGESPTNVIRSMSMGVVLRGVGRQGTRWQPTDSDRSGVYAPAVGGSSLDNPGRAGRLCNWNRDLAAIVSVSDWTRAILFFRQ
jgi:hypothetical protein